MSDAETKTIDPEIEPEYVGAHSGIDRADCRNWKEPHADGKCENDATHTVVMFQGHGEVAQLAMCDECGQPEDVTTDNRVWSGEVQE